MAGQGAKRRANLKSSRAKQARKKKAAEGAEVTANMQPLDTLRIPTITEEDLLAFQISHFGDDIKPNDWFIDAETALNYDPAFDDEDEDGLGYYEDGVKRTLTDEQIEMFRHTELAQLARHSKTDRDEDGEQGNQDHDLNRAASPALSDVSSIEDELLGLAQPRPRRASQIKERQPSRSSRSETSHSTYPSKLPRKEEVPYDQRHKRKWEEFVEEIDPLEGSLTHRRIVRELDEQQNNAVDLDY